VVSSNVQPEHRTRDVSRFVCRFRQASKAISAVVAALGLVVLGGWAFNVPALTYIRPSFQSMKVNTALSFLCLGTGLWLGQDDKWQRSRRVLGFFVVIIAGLTLAEYALHVSLGIDQLLFRDTRTPSLSAYPGRMAIATATCFILLGLAVTLLGTNKAVALQRSLVAVCFTLSLVALCGYLYGVHSLYSMTAYSTVAVHTAAGFLAACLAYFLAQPDRGIVSIAASETDSGLLLRTVVPAIVVLPIIIGWLRLVGQRANLYDTPFGVALQVIGSIVCLTALTLVIARSMHRWESEHSRAEQARVRSAAIVESSDDAIVSGNLDGIIVGWNSGAQHIYGYTEAEAVGKSITILVPPELPDEENQILERLRAGGRVEHFETIRVTKTGKKVNVSLTISPIKDSSGRTVGISGIARDITERKLAQETLRESEERFRLAAQAGKMYAYEWNVATDAIVRAGDVSGVLGSTGEASLTRQQLLARVHPDDRALFNASVSERTPEHPDVQISHRLLCPDGSVVWVEKTAHALFDEGGRMVRMIGMVTDITERKRAEEAIRESERQYRRIVETTNEGVWLLDSNLHNSYVNRQMAEMLGYEAREMVGRSVFDFYFPEDVERKKQVLMRRQQGRSEQIDERLRRRDGSELWVRIAATPVFKDNGEFDGALAMVSDITERRRAQEELRESEGRFRLAAQAGKMYAFEWDVTTDVLVRSSEYVNVLGANEPRTLTHQQAIEKIHPDDRAKLAAAVARHSPEKPTVDVTYRMLLPGKSPVWVKSSGRAFFDGEGRMLRVIGMVADVTDQKLAEEALSTMSGKLIEAQEQERARIARELHDDINQRLALLTIELEQLQDNPSEVRRQVQELRKQTAEISNDVQALSHDLHSSQLEYLGAVAGLQGWCKEFAERQKMEIDCRHDVRSVLPPEIGLCLFRVLQEGLHNAAKHSGVKRVEVQLHEEPGEIHLSVRDFGKGFDVEAARQGRGLGLTSMRERVRLVNGTIAIESKPMGGTTIRVRVPFESEDGSQRAAG